MPHRPHVALLIESSRAYGRGLLMGIAQYARLHGNWAIYHQERAINDAAPNWLARWKGDGVIARIENPALIRSLRKLDLPTVDLRGLHKLAGVPLVETDDQLVMRLAIEHLRERGYERLAYCGFPGVNYSDRRLHYCRQVLGTAALEVYEPSTGKPGEPGEPGEPARKATTKTLGTPAGERQKKLAASRLLDEPPHPSPLPPSGERGLAYTSSRGQWRRSTAQTVAIETEGILYEDAIAHWLMRLPKPIGLIACNDIRGQQVLNAARAHCIAAPEEVAVVGVDNDEMLCELSDPPLSSVEPDTERIGYEAAALLDRMMKGEPPPVATVYVPPRGVVARQSTESLAIADRQVAAAVRFIRQHACDGIGVGEVIAHVALSRSTLERRFDKLLRRSPKEEIVRVRIERAKRLLEETNYHQGKIAEMTGFRHAEYLNVVFKQHVGLTPGKYRQRQAHA